MVKKIRAISLFMLICVIFGAFAGCNKSTITNNEGDTAMEETMQMQQTTEEVTEVENIAVSSIKINGVDISKFSIVYQMSFTKEQCYEDYGVLACRLSDEINSMIGTTLSLTPETKPVRQTYEIVLGVTEKRTEWASYNKKNPALTEDDYCVAYENKKILIGATCLAGVTDAVEAFISHILSEAKANGGDVNISDSLNIRGTNHVTRVVCVGDSITHGNNTTVPYSYPSKLEAMLGDEYDVLNYGKSGATMCSKVTDRFKNQRSYINKSGYYDDLLAVAPKTDIVVIMLGTNDADGRDDVKDMLDNNFSILAADYKANLTKMVNDLRTKNKDIKIVLINAPKRFEDNAEYYYSTYLRPMQKSLAGELGILFYDIFSYTDSNMTRDDYLDATHPNNIGNEKLASGISEALEVLLGIKKNTVEHFLHLSFDDVYQCFTNLKKNQNTYQSLYDEPFFAWLKKMNTTYQARFSLYVFNDYMSDIPSKFADDFYAAKDWLKIGLHAPNNSKNYTNYTYEQGKAEWNSFVDNIYRITGSYENLDRIPRLHNFAGSEAALKGMRDANYGALGFLSADDTRNSYYLNKELSTYLFDHDYVKDQKNNLIFITTDFRTEWFNSSTPSAKGPVESTMYFELLSKYTDENYADSVSTFILFGHETSFYDGKTISSKNAKYIENACMFAQECGICIDFPQNRVFSDTYMDIK